MSRKHEVSAMGDADMNRGRTLPGLGRVRRGATARPGAALRLGWVLFCLAVLVPGCRSGGSPQEPAVVTPPASQAETQGEETAGEDSPEAVEVTGITVREGAPGTLVEVSAVEPLVWTSFRDLEGRVVVELPNAVLGEDVEEIREPEGVLESIELDEDASGRRPLARLVVATREEVEHNLRAEGDRLVLELDPVGPAPAPAGRPALAFEPIPEDEPEAAGVTEEEAAPPPAPPQPAPPEPAPARLAESPGTAENPRRGPEPTGATASRLSGITVTGEGDTLAVEIQGDGQFAYSTFHLADPDRFVVDLEGVVNRAERSVLPVETGPLERIRVAQFRPFPEPVSRVVLDLTEHGFPEVERTPDALVLRFGPQRQAAAAPARPEPPVPPAPEAVVAQDVPNPDPEPATDDSVLVQVPAEEEPEPPAPEPASPAPEPEPDIEIEPPTSESSPADDRPAEELQTRDRPVEPRPGQLPEDVAPVPSPRSEPDPDSGELSDASLFDATEIEVDRPTAEGDEGDLNFGTRQVGGEREYFGEPIDMTLRDADVVETLRSFAEISGLNIVVQPEVSGQVTVELHQVPWDQALDQILRINQLGYEVEGNIMRVAPLSMLRQEAQERQELAAAQALSIPLETVMKRLSYTSAQNIASILQRGGTGGILSQRGSVIVDDRTNTLIISELPDYMDTVLSIINNLDEPEPQVMIEARIIETTKRFSRELGISWGFDMTAGAATGNTTGIEFPNNFDAGGSVNLGTAGQNALLNLRFGNVLNTFQLDTVLNAAEEDGLVNILSTPKVATLNNHQATIQSGLQVPIQTVANNTVTVQFVNATLELQVTPQITADGTVLMDIAIQKREVQTAFLVPGATNAPIATKEAATQVMVRDGGTAVIGGIYEVSTDQAENRVPGLSNIPILGHLFRNRSRTDENEELLIFITPRVMRI